MTDEGTQNVRGQARCRILIPVVTQRAIPPDGTRREDCTALAGLKVHHVRAPTRGLALAAKGLENCERRVKAFLGHPRCRDHERVRRGTHQYVCKIDFVRSSSAEKCA